MNLSPEESSYYINSLAQAAPFQFVDRVVWMSKDKVITELNSGGLPNRFTQQNYVDTYVMLEYVAQSSGLLLKEKKDQQRGVIASFKNVERLVFTETAFPIRLESTLVEERAPMYTFYFQVFADDQVIVRGTTRIFIGG